MGSGHEVLVRSAQGEKEIKKERALCKAKDVTVWWESVVVEHHLARWRPSDLRSAHMITNTKHGARGIEKRLILGATYEVFREKAITDPSGGCPHSTANPSSPFRTH